MAGGIAWVVVVEPSGVVDPVSGGVEPGEVDPPATVLEVSTASGVQAPTTRTRAMRKTRRRSISRSGYRPPTIRPDPSERTWA